MAEEHRSTCLVLFSGGLDSILACKVLQSQGVKVIAIKFITPFFGYELKGKEEEAKATILEKYGIDMDVVDISEPYLTMLKNPPHGYGRYFNPCIDCKILMIKQAITLMPRYNADFIATGEVLGQRPMSQRRDALRIVERDSGSTGLLLRPLCALRLKPTPMEEKGLVDRSRLLGITGRGRKEQMALAGRYGITDYPAPAGGCVLADPILSGRFKRLLEYWGQTMNVNNFLLAQVGRQFILPDGSWFIVGRKEGENKRLEELIRDEDLELRLVKGPGPLGILRGPGESMAVEHAARILLRYSKARDRTAQVMVTRHGTEEREVLEVQAASQEEIDSLRI